ncbi:ribosome-binding factor A [Moraxella bovoculi]|uniref:Ribosome-binding factor A n=1 Tax=Moraxella bovoculi TaxID=386891 RepID=A0AAC8PWX2_9GAMM|nr:MULTISPECIES: ribosome-binding factor A [Moraxella]AKG08498.1 ribosome-binding factor A [Moraxella bovoculi]AKG10335.1 ribosome-binding factor A [Moraxella bovoculi]AKG12359.1 ribosome-binding factor A [Moraxella bovoculi]AKG14321.1 ribosome-binding factor A [Moraxella bovoculi]MCP3897558.1 ribosome-binding factor A [Moraxella sp.]
MNQRLQRLADQIQRTLSVLIRDEINDPRLTGFVTISGVKVSPDLGYADVYVTILEPSQDGGMNKEAHQESINVLKNAAGFLRTELSHTMKTRTTPRLRFHYDEVTAHGNHMMNLVSQAMQKTGESEADDTDNS